jgi:hypothetical protein
MARMRILRRLLVPAIRQLNVAEQQVDAATETTKEGRSTEERGALVEY